MADNLVDNSNMDEVQKPPVAGSAISGNGADNSSDAGSSADNGLPGGDSSLPEGSSTPTAPDKKELSKKEMQVMESMQDSFSINLLPKQTEEEKAIEKKKNSVGFGSVSIALVVGIISIVVVFSNLGVRLAKDRAVNNMQTKEQEVLGHSDVILANDQINRRYQLYSDIQTNTFSPKNVMLYWNGIAAEYGLIDNIELRDNLRFTFDGQTTDLATAAQLWHLLSMDPRVDSILLSSVSKSGDRVTYTFDGELNFEYFLNQEAFERTEDNSGNF